VTVPTAFYTAAPGDRTLAAGAYILGTAELAALIVALAFGAYRVRGLLLPAWSGAPARLVEIVLAATGLVWVSEALGTFGGFEEYAVLGVGIAVGLAAGFIATRLARRRVAPTGPPSPPSWEVAKVVAVLACAAVVAGWMVPTLGTFAAGMDRADSLWYHMPLSAKFVQTGYLGHIYFFDPVFLASFYPANSEVTHAVPILFFARDIASPVMNLGWLALTLLAAYCIGRPYGLGPQAMVGSAIGLGSQSLVEFQAGEALNDITGVAFILAAVAILVNGYAASRAASGDRPATPDGEPPPSLVTGRAIAPAALAMAGIAAGFAAGVKLSFLAPVAALTVGVIVIAPGSARLRATLAFVIPSLVAGGYWYLRNLIAVGNPIPYIGHIGPISLPAPVRDFQLRPDYAVVHYWNDTGVWSHWFAPGLHESFGTLWPATLIGMLATAIFAIWRGREPILRVLGAFVIVTTVAYVLTPLTAAGEQGQPISFVWNVRYLAPAVTVGLAILPCLPAARATARRRVTVLIALCIVLAFTVGSLVQWKQGHTKGAVAAGVLVVVLAAAIAIAHRRYWFKGADRWWARIAVGAAAVIAIVAAGYIGQRHYLEHRYENTGQTQDLASALRWARDIRDARIAIGGIRGVFTQYPFYGTDLSNEVQWLGKRGPHDAYNRIPDCRQWRRAIDAGGFTHVVTTFDPYFPGTMRNSPEGRWTGSDPNAHVVLRDGPVRVFELRGPLDPARCAGQKPLSRAQLHSVPNLNSTLGSAK
jgi:membrane protein YdbS with pleckstrin-like domain